MKIVRQIRNLRDLNLSITLSLIMPLLFAILLLTTSFFSFYFVYLSLNKKKNINEIYYTNSLYQSELSEKLSIIANSPTFIQYLRSGVITRNQMMPDLLTTLLPLKEIAVVGIKINTTNAGKIFQKGTTSSFFVNLQACYTGTILDNSEGDCGKYTITLYFNKNKYIKSLTSFNRSILSCSNKNCLKINLINNKIGRFNVINSSGSFVSLNVKNDITLPLFVIYLCCITIVFLLGVLNYFRIKKLLLNFITLPITDLTKKMKNNDNLQISEKYIDEINFLQNEIVEFKKNEQNAKIGLIIKQVAHDIRSPVAAILMLVQECHELPEEQRISLRNVANRIQDIANNLLHSAEEKQTKKPTDTITHFLVSTAVLSAISEKRLQYKNTDVKIDYTFGQNAIFAFINVNLPEFKRVISNLLNNAIEAIESDGNILVQVTTDEHLIKVSIIDSGKGMLPDVRDKILNGQAISNKTDGLGLGFSHTRTFLAASEGKLEISTPENKGLVVSLIFKKTMPPAWIANEIGFYSNSVVVILDDDSSIHGAWDSLFATTLSEYPELQIVHFTQAVKCIEYLKGLQPEMREKLLFLTDYELIKQNFNGLDVIELVQLNQAILVTSHYENQDILKRAALLNTKVLPKLLAPSIKLQLIKESVSVKKTIDLVILEDNKELSDVLVYLCKFRGKLVDVYHESYALFESLNQYDKLTTKICLDFDLNCLVNGIEVATALHQRGFELLFLATGHKSINVEVPEYVNLLPDKMALLKL